MKASWRLAVLLAGVAGVAGAGVAACGGNGSVAQAGSTSGSASGGGQGGSVTGAGPGGQTATSSAGSTASSSGASGGGGSTAIDAGVDACVSSSLPDAGICYVDACAGTVHALQDNRDRLIRDFAVRKCTDSCGLWAALNQAERYVFLMVTTYLAAPASLVYPPGSGNLETELDHAVALYSINGPKAGQGTDLSGRGGNDYNRIYLGFDALGECVMRNFAEINPTNAPDFNQWVKSDDVAGPHAPFTQREMIYWYKAFYDLQSNGPQFHHWAKDADFDQSGLNQRLGVCGVTDRSLAELTIAFDFYHSSDPLGDYAGVGGYGWQIVDMYSGITADWSYMPTGCPVTAPVNTDPYGGGTFAGMGPSLSNGVCVATPLGDAGCGP